MRIKIIALLLILSVLFPTSALANAPAEVSNNEVSFSFPLSATFQAKITSAVEIRSVVLEYGNEQQTCGDVVAKAFPQFTAGKTANVAWTWEMRQSGSLPPGAKLWWRWRVTDANGTETVSETKTAVWLDDDHNWKTISEGLINFHWYNGDTAFAQDLVNAAQGGLKFNETESGLRAEEPIEIYIYADTNDLKDAVLYEPAWTGGQAFPEQNIVILGISEEDMDWGRDSIVHELTHVLVGHLTFSCLGDVPTWLNEGLAVYSEGELDEASQAQLENAIQSDTLLTVRSLSAGFSEVADKAYLSYSQSYSLTKFLIEEYGQDKMTALLTSLRDGITIDEALTKIYGFNVEGLEDAWRANIGAKARTAQIQPTAQPTPTFVPTIVPVSGAEFIQSITPTPLPTSSFNSTPETQTTDTDTTFTLTMILLACCCILLVGLAIGGVIFFIVRQNRKGGKNVQ